MAEKIYQGKTKVPIKGMGSGDAWLGSLHGPEPDQGELMRAILSPDTRAPGQRLHAHGGRVKNYCKGGKVISSSGR